MFESAEPAGVSSVTLFRDVAAGAAKVYPWTIDELDYAIRNSRTYPDKKSCPLIKLARFGDSPSERGSLRHDANVLEVSGIEADYDGEQISLAEAQMMLSDNGIDALLYTSPSHTAERPRWRVLCLLSRPYFPGERARFVARLNGALGGILAPESFNLSQSYYVGRVQGAQFEVARVRGQWIDQLDGLDVKAIGPKKNGESRAERLAAIRSADPVITRLAERSMILRQRTDGTVDIVCPFESEHTTPRARGDCTYFPPHTGGYARGHFKCLHGHCANKRDEDFFRAIGIDVAPAVEQREGTAATPAQPATETRRETAEQVEIANLAKLSRFDYDRARKSAAERLGIRTETLDAEVRRIRDDLEDSEDELLFPSREPWGESVKGTELMDELVSTFGSYMVLQAHADTALALWTLATYLVDQVEVAPILAVVSPEKRCGKTSLLGVLSRLTNRPLAASNISPAALFRSIEKWSPTLLIDEGDAFLGENEELRGILNSGHTRDTAFVIRTVGDDHEPAKFSTWGMKAIALIGTLPDTLADRSIAVELRRKLPSERVQKLRHGADLEPMARKCLRWATDNAPRVRGLLPQIPEELSDRAGDNWEPLLTIAELIGSEWSKAARDAASVLSGATADGDSTKVELLRDVQALFAGRFDERQAVGSAELVEALTEDKAGRWFEFGHGKPLTQGKLARLLKPFGIAPGTVRNSSQTFKGYYVEAFSDAFRRYIPGFKTSHRHKPITARVVTDFETVTGGSLCHFEKASQASNGAGCDGVTFSKQEIGGAAGGSSENGGMEL